MGNCSLWRAALKSRLGGFLVEKGMGPSFHDLMPCPPKDMSADISISTCLSPMSYFSNGSRLRRRRGLTQ